MDDPANGPVEPPDEDPFEDPVEDDLEDEFSAASGDDAADGGAAGDAGGPGRDDRATVDWLLSILGPRIDEARSLVDELGSRWRGDAQRLGEGTRQRLQDLFRDLGLVTEAAQDDLELRVAQLEHRVRLLEGDDRPPGG
jgi:hypothetical protein